MDKNLIMPSLRDLYENFKKADYALSDEELVFLIEKIEATIELLGAGSGQVRVGRTADSREGLGHC